MAGDDRTTEATIADLSTIVAALFAGTSERIYPAQAAGLVEPIKRLATDAEQRGDAALAKSLRRSLQDVERMIPPSR